MDKDQNYFDLTTYSIFALFLFLFLIFHLYLITTLRQKYLALATNNRLLIFDIPPDRGIIQADHGTPLTLNQPTYILQILNYNGLNELKQLQNVELNKKIQDALSQGKSPNLKNQIQDIKSNKFPIVVQSLDEKLATQLQQYHSNNYKILISIKRSYKYPYQLAHIIGYTSIVFKEDLERDPTLHANDIIGRTGLEKQYDQYLRGKHGEKVVEINALGQIINELNDKSTNPIPGDNIITNINLKMQISLYNAIAKVTNKYHIKGGAGIILDVNSGAVKALVSYPSYNINDFARGISASEYKKLINNPRLPLFNRATMAQAPPGSTFKTMVATAALQEKAITENTKFYSSGTITLPGGTPFQEYHKHVYGWLTVRDALMVSSNIFFCKTALRLGINKLDNYLNLFGVGHKTGIDLPSEASGRLPSIANKIYLAQHGATWLEPVWYPEGDTCNSAIGQGITLLTPIQLAVVAATIANKGTVYKPYIVKQIKGQLITKTIKPVVVNKIPASKHVFDIVQQGMHMSVHGPRSIIPNLRNVPVDVAAKTGTAEFGIKTKNGYLTTHAWVMGFYPYTKPKYAFVVFLEAGGSSLHASEVMQDFLNSIYK